MLKFFQKIILGLTLACALFGASGVLAVEIPFDPEDAGTVEVTVQDSENTVGAEDSRESPVDQAGVIQLRAIMLNAYFFLKYSLIVVAVGYLSLNGIYLVTAGKNIEEKVTKAKANIKWIIYGLFGFLMIDTFVGAFFGQGDVAGMIFHDTTNDSVLYQTATKFTYELFSLTDFLLSFASLLGVLIIIISALTIVGAFGNENIISSQKKISMVVVGGLVIIALAKTVVGRVLFGIAGYDETGHIITDITKGGEVVSPKNVGFLVDAQAGTDEIIGIANYILGFVGILALVMFVYGGLRLVMAQGDSGAIDKAKSIMTSAIIGVVIAICSYTLVATFINPS